MKTFNLTDRFRSIGHALEGLAYVLKTQHNAWIHLFMTILVILTGLYYQITQVNWMLLSVAIFSVWVAEVFNTALEILCDIVKPEIHPAVKKVKDIAAGAVLLSALGAVVIGLMVFLPYIK